MYNYVTFIKEEIGSKRKKDTDIIYEDKNLIILVPKTHEATVSYSQNTKWCTGTSDKIGTEMYKKHKDDILFRIFFKNGNKIRLTWGSTSFTWGLGGKTNEYVAFSKRNMKTPFNINALKKYKDIELSKEYGWWRNSHETLYKLMLQLPENAKEAMLNYHSTNTTM